MTNDNDNDNDNALQGGWLTKGQVVDFKWLTFGG